MHNAPIVFSIARRDGQPPLKVIRCVTPDQVTSQGDVPAYVLALVSLLPLDKTGRLLWSPFTRDRFKSLQTQYGDNVLRDALRGLLLDILNGLRPHNPIGLFIHRVMSVSAFGRPLEV